LTLVYRAIWNDSDHIAPAVLKDEFALWCESKGIPRDQIPTRGIEEFGQRSVEVRRADTEIGAVLRTRLIEKDGEDRVWTTTATALSEPGDIPSTYWIELDCEAPNSDRPPMAAPRLSTQILEVPGSARRGPVPLSAKPQVILDASTAGRVVELVFDPARDIPIVIFSPDVRVSPEINHKRAASAARRLAGIAAVHLLSPDAIELFNQKMPDGFRVYGGAVRHYLPGVQVDDDADSVRHRWYGVKQINRSVPRAGDLVARRLASLQQWPQEPEAWRRFRPLISRPTDEEIADRVAGIVGQIAASGTEPKGLQQELDEVLSLLVIAEADRDEQAKVLNAEAARLREDAARMEQELTDAVDAQEDLQTQVLAQNVMLRAALRGAAPAGDAATPDPGALPLPDGVAEAIELGVSHLQRVVIHPDAPQEIDSIEENLKYQVWARGLWQGLIALEHYAEAVALGEAVGGLWQWCTDTAEWPADKLAMGESDLVANNPRLRLPRVLPIDPAVGQGERTFMGSHLKIQKGGGPQIPRVYFYDDTAGVTGKIHIGFIGPHSLMPNTKTN